MPKLTYNRTHYDNDWDNRIRKEWFPKHQALVKSTTPEDPVILHWRNPENSNYSCNYIIHRGTLAVFGDIGEAVYQWGQVLTLEWLAGLHLDYFCGKCCASEFGREYYDWDCRVAKMKIDVSLEGVETEKRFLFENTGGSDCMSRKDEWAHWLSVNGHDVFGEEYVELGNIGKVIAWRCRGHLIGIKMAVAQITGKPA